jgi:hypothetical protein
VEGERDRERKIWGEREINPAVRKTGWVDFDCWSKSTTPENFLRVSINKNNGRIKRQSNLGVAFDIPQLFLAQQHSLE